MKNTIQLLALFLSFTAFSQGSQSNMKASEIYSNYLSAIDADDLDDTNNIMTIYKGQSAMGEITIEKTTSKEKIVEKWMLAGTVLFHIVASNEQCYQVSNGEQKLLPDTMCDDFKPFIGLFSEVSLQEVEGMTVQEIEVNEEKCYEVSLPGASTSHNFIYSVETGLKLKEVQTTKSGDKVSESSITFKDYEERNGMKFPTIQVHSNFLQTGTDVEFKLESVEFNVPEVKE